MGVFIDQDKQIFHLQTVSTSYVFQVLPSGYLAHLYYGKKLRAGDLSWLLVSQERASFSPNPVPEDRSISLDTLPQELPVYGTSDFRHPVLQCRLSDGSTVTEFTYQSHRVEQGKPSLAGLPATYVEEEREAQTLIVELQDKVSGLRVELQYSAFEQYDAITRSMVILNDSNESVQLLRVLSASIDFPHADYEWLQLSGAWSRERDIVRRPLASGTQSVESRRGSSSHQQNPFAALLSPGSDEDQGEVFGFSLVYSGSFVAQAEVDQFRTTRFSIGINPFEFQWALEAGQAFQTPEVVMVYSSEGLGGMSSKYHNLYRERLARGKYRDAERPVLVNNWEATYFQFNADKIEDIAKAGQELGIELFVLDDGWFGHRDSDNSSLGDWVVDKKKLPNGLEDLVSRVTNQGMRFGLWFEPEMVSPDSELYHNHPDWCLHVPDRRRTEGRQQLVLDFSRQDVQDEIVRMLSEILKSSPITYVKWDMNRNMTEIGSALLPPERQQETAHRYMLGLYDVLERITSSFPDILFESCSGGGGRFDPGMLYYMPQTWTSDNTDAVARLRIQYGTSLVYPISSMGSHISAVPNHQVGRTTPLEMRGHVAMSGNFGYELDLTKFSDEEKDIVKQQISLYKEIRSLIQFGNFHRLLSPFEGNETAWMFVSPDGSEVAVFYFRVLSESNAPLNRLKLKGLDLHADYRLVRGSEVFGGDALMYAGIPVGAEPGDYHSELFRFERV
ncbi:alpha-galactosidase [Paenibacillus crassostreae]|uniref:Alpha-galactosidase n=1 Tax=Paenibacillus crassostreae TaxID=1763538 RepID=A0A167GLA0_9BACL|nr:alpha-galactosidase [Paenibacillus crassostreae]AOZ92217.1 alpha-galactosidase [Paenibacillus crassostreae]OAB77679.1 alpha-galactosidase [Paenibacillus crassostreae]